MASALLVQGEEDKDFEKYLRGDFKNEGMIIFKKGYIFRGINDFD